MRSIVFALLVLISGQVFADLEVVDYPKFKNLDVFKNYVFGVGEGLMWANGELTSRNEKLIYCQPGKLALIMDNYLQILDDELKANVYKPSVPIAFVLREGLKHTFQCK